MTQPPRYYSEWIQLLDLLKQHEQEAERVIELLESGSLEWKSGVADKILQAISEIIDMKARRTMECFQAELRCTDDEETMLVAAIINARNRFATQFRLCRLPVIPSDIKEKLEQMLTEYIRESQASLLKSAEHDRTGYLAYIIKNNSLLQVVKNEKEQQGSVEQTSRVEEHVTNTFKTSRRVLL